MMTKMLIALIACHLFVMGYLVGKIVWQPDAPVKVEVMK